MKQKERHSSASSGKFVGEDRVKNSESNKHQVTGALLSYGGGERFKQQDTAVKVEHTHRETVAQVLIAGALECVQARVAYRRHMRRPLSHSYSLYNTHTVSSPSPEGAVS